ncbi:hypothetical protein D3C78_1121950 [compost metagenome]
MAQQNAPLGQALAARGVHVFAAGFDQRLAAGRARVIGPLHQHQGQDHIAYALAHVGQDHQGHQDGGEGQQQVDHAHDQRVDLAAGIGRHQADDGADHGRNRRRAHAHQQADAQAVHDRRVQVAPLAVRAQPVGEAMLLAGRSRGQAGIEHVQLHQVIGVLRRDERREQRHQDDEQQRDQADDGGLGAQEVVRDLRPEGLDAACIGAAGVGGGRRNSGNSAHWAASRRTRGSSSL